MRASHAIRFRVASDVNFKKQAKRNGRKVANSSEMKRMEMLPYPGIFRSHFFVISSFVIKNIGPPKSLSKSIPSSSWRNTTQRKAPNARQRKDDDDGVCKYQQLKHKERR